MACPDTVVAGWGDSRQTSARYLENDKWYPFHCDSVVSSGPPKVINLTAYPPGWWIVPAHERELCPVRDRRWQPG
jgi:hypothetical protein